jgi:DNA-binding phage protein
MPRPKNPNNNYFNSNVETAVHLYNLSTDDKEKNKLFNTIYPALAKLAEVWRNKIKPVFVELTPEELEMDCITYMLERLHMVKEGKGKAFSYLTVTARNYYIQENMKSYAKKLKGYAIEAMPDTFDVADVSNDRVEQMEWNGALFDSFIEYIEENFEHMFVNKVSKIFGRCLIVKLKEYALTPDFNRRKMMNELASESGIERGKVTKQLNRIASQYSVFKEYYQKHGEKPMFLQKAELTESDIEYIKNNYEHYSKRNGLAGMSRQLGLGYDIVKKYIKSTL